MFPWAEGGDLEDFWKEANPRLRSPELTLWSLKQMLGLAEALEGLHQGFDDESNFRHGNLKPGNILHFLGAGEGILKIAGFEISRAHHNATYDRAKPTISRATTPSYEAPEATLVIRNREPRSPKYDIWSLGCIFLEFTIWLVHNWEEVQIFYEARKLNSPMDYNSGHFYQITGLTVQSHQAVYQKIADLKMVPQSKEDTALGDLLNLIQNNLLEVQVDARFDSTQLCKRSTRLSAERSLTPSISSTRELQLFEHKNSHVQLGICRDKLRCINEINFRQIEHLIISFMQLNKDILERAT